MKKVLFLFVFFSSFFGKVYPQADTIFNAEDFQLEVPDFFVDGIPSTGSVICGDIDKLAQYEGKLSAVINGQRKQLVFEGNRAEFDLSFDRPEPMSIMIGPLTYVREVNPMPLWLSIIPPLIVILLALLFKEVVSSLLIGIFIGASIRGYYTFDSGLGEGFFRVIDTYLINALYDTGHLSVIVFSTLIGGIVAVISKNGGMQGIVNRISVKATDAKKGQLVTWVLGIAIFFDDYANTLVVGNTMRPVTDALRISREKLSYIVDSTAAPVAAVALITTWIGAELGYIQGALDTINAGTVAIDKNAYAIFLGSLQYAFYPFLCLAFILLLIFTNRDFGPMYKAEVLARREGVRLSSKKSVELEEFEPIEGVVPRSINAILPISVIVFGTVAGLFYTGYDPLVWHDSTVGLGKKLSIIIGNADSYKALLWASFGGLVLAILISWLRRIMSFGQAIESSISGFKTMVNALVILILAWSLAAITEDLNTAEYLSGLAHGTVAVWAVPAITFLISALVAFSTGSSWGTMAIVYPLMLPLCWELSIKSGLSQEMALGLFYNVTSCVLAGSVLGDHCSPISDTTILSSLSTQCDHVAHVNTQLPYALTVGFISVLLTTFSALWVLPWFITFPFGLLVLYGIIRFIGKKIPDPA